MIVQFVGRDEIPDYEARGWKVTNDLSDSHHGANGVMMERYETPTLAFLRQPQVSEDACTLCVVHEGQEIYIPLTAGRLGIIMEDAAKYMSRFVRKHG